MGEIRRGLGTCASPSYISLSLALITYTNITQTNLNIGYTVEANGLLGDVGNVLWGAGQGSKGPAQGRLGCTNPFSSQTLTTYHIPAITQPTLPPSTHSLDFYRINPQS